MVPNVTVYVWFLFHFIVFSGDASISKSNGLKQHEAELGNFLRVMSEKTDDEGSGAVSRNDEEPAGVIEIIYEVSRLQCSHRCKLNKKCKDVAYEDGNTCHLLGQEMKVLKTRFEIIHPGMIDRICSLLTIFS